MFFRRDVSYGEWLEVKMWLFTIGSLLALLGMLWRNDWLIGAAAIVLIGGIAVRFLDRKSASDPTGDDPDDDPDADDPSPDAEDRSRAADPGPAPRPGPR